MQEADHHRHGWFPYHWSVDQAGRIVLLLSLPSQDEETYGRSLSKLFTAADVGELVALYQSLPLLAHPERLRQQAVEGVRSNMPEKIPEKMIFIDPHIHTTSIRVKAGRRCFIT